MSDETTPQVPQPASDTSSEMNAADTDSSDNSRPEPTASSDKANAVSSAISNTAPDSATAIAPASPVSQSRWQRTKTLWQGLLALVRSRLPASWQPRLSNGVLSALFLGLGVFSLIFVFALLAPTTPLPARQPLVVLPSDAPAAAEASQAELVLPPEDVIAEIQDQVAGITQQYAEGLVQSVQANFRQSELTVNLGPQWYQLSRDRQDQVANGIFETVQTLAFNKLLLTDSSGKPLARSPVVGDKMVILQRQG